VLEWPFSDGFQPSERFVRHALIEGRGCELLYLPPYSPDLNPIEEAFSKVKALLRRAGARAREALVEAIGRALDAVTSQDARGFFEHCGYSLQSQRQ
jgi:transposase